MGSRTEKVIDVLRASKTPLWNKDIATMTGLHVAQVGVALRSLARFGLVQKTGSGWEATRDSTRSPHLGKPRRVTAHLRSVGD